MKLSLFSQGCFRYPKFTPSTMNKWEIHRAYLFCLFMVDQEDRLEINIEDSLILKNAVQFYTIKEGVDKVSLSLSFKKMIPLIWLKISKN